MTRYLGVATDDMSAQTLREQLASQDLTSSGAAFVGYDGETVESALDKAKAFANYEELRAYRGMASVIRITDPGIDGIFQEVVAISPVDNGGTRIIDASGRVWDRVYDDYINVKWFGVKGDGVTNDQDVFNKIFRYVESIDGANLFVPRGIYFCGGVAGDVFARTMILPKTTDNGFTKIVCHPDAVFKRKGPYTLFASTSVDDRYSGYGSNGRNITWIGGVMDANAAAIGVNNLWGLVGCDNITIQGVTFYNGTGGHCIDLNSSKSVFIRDCVFYSEPIANGILTKEAIQMAEFRQSTANGGTLGLDNILVENCRFLAKPGQPVGWQIGVGNHSATDGIWHKNIKIINNLFDGCTETGVQIFKHSDSLIQGNTFLSCRDGVRSIQSRSDFDNSQDQDGNPSGRSQTAYNVKVLNNTFYDTTRTPINLQSPSYTSALPYTFHDRWLIEGNTFGSPGGLVQTGAAAVVAYWCSNLKVINNYMFNQRRGIQAMYVKDSQFIGNTINTTVSEAIIVQETIDTDYAGQGLTNNIDIRDNNIYYIGGTPCVASGGKSVNVINNTFRDTLAVDATRVAVSFSGSVSDCIASGNVVKASLGAARLKGIVEIGGGTLNCVASMNLGAMNVSSGFPTTNTSTTSFSDEIGTVAPENAIAAALYSRYYNRLTGIAYRKTGGGTGATGWVTP